MTQTSHRPPTDSSGSSSSGSSDSSGFTLLAVLMGVAVIASFVAAYGRHVVVEGRGGIASPALLSSREVCHSGLQCVRQSLVAGQDIAGTIPVGSDTADVIIASLTGGHYGIQVQALDSDGLGSRRVAEMALQPTANSDPDGPTSLPTLNSVTVDGLLADPALTIHHYTTSEDLSSIDVSGLLVVHAGVDLVLRDVVIQGAIISASVLSQEPLGEFDAMQAPRVTLSGNVRIDSHSSLPGVAILLPDGIVESGVADARLQIHGDVVAHDLTLLNEGVLDGNVAAVDSQLADSTVLDRLGWDRRSTAWSAALKLGGTHEPVFIAIVPPTTSLEAMAPIIGYWDGQ